MSSPAQVPWLEALMAMVAMIVVLIFIVAVYCIIPCYRNYQKQRQQARENLVNDPRWENLDHFSFVPKRPQNYLSDKKFSKSVACNKTSPSPYPLTEEVDLEEGQRVPARVSVPMPFRHKRATKLSDMSEESASEDPAASLVNVSTESCGRPECSTVSEPDETSQPEQPQKQTKAKSRPGQKAPKN